MSGTSVIKSVPSQDMLSELRTFVAGATRAVKTNPLELARTALSLLKTLPAARGAVLEYFCTLFDAAVCKYVTHVEAVISNMASPGGGGHEDATISEIHDVLCSFVTSNPEAWAPIISTWSLELLAVISRIPTTGSSDNFFEDYDNNGSPGVYNERKDRLTQDFGFSLLFQGELSSCYAGRAHVPLPAGLNETLQLWMSCRATRTLIDIITQCLSCLIHSNTEACINALLDTSVTHSPHFDWVVAHVGSCFPHTVITRVLSCGLKDFCQHGCAEQGVKAPKLLSVVGILGHLASSHFMDIRTSLLELFRWSLEPGGVEDKIQRQATVPFLLQLASLSNTLLRALTTDVLHTLSPDMLPQLAKLAPDWCRYFGNRNALEDLIVHLARGCEQGGTQILRLLLDAVSSDPDRIDPSVMTSCKEILELLLQEMDLLLRNSGPGSFSVPLLYSVKQDVAIIQPLLLSPDPVRVQTAVRLLGLLGYQSHMVLVCSASYLLRRAVTDTQLAAVIHIVMSGFYSASTATKLEKERREKNSTLANALELALRNFNYCEPSTSVAPEQLWLNIARLLKWENSGRAPISRNNLIVNAVRVNLREASDLLRDPPSNAVAHVIATALDLAAIPNYRESVGPGVQLTLKFAEATVSYFFLCVAETDSLVRIRGVRVCCRLLSRLSLYSSPARAFALRELLEGSLFYTHAWLFGSICKTKVDQLVEVRLLHENHKQGTSAMLAQRHSSVFHAGVIGHGPRHPGPINSLSHVNVADNTQLLIEAIKACCANGTGPEDQLAPNSPPISLEAITTVSLLLVELISPDVMYNGLPWPEEEFCKVTVERDLHIRQVFDSLPLAWELMALVASHRPALCYCSVLLRALTATLLAQWGSWQRNNSGLVNTTVRMLELLALGQLLPPPLASLRDVVPHLKPQEVVQLLRDCVWNYMRDYVPSPALFTRDATGLMWRDATLARPSPQYTDTLRFTLQNNISKLGALYAQLFLTRTAIEFQVQENS